MEKENQGEQPFSVVLADVYQDSIFAKHCHQSQPPPKSAVRKKKTDLTQKEGKNHG